MNDNTSSFLTVILSAKKIIRKETIQSLWSGYGSIVRYEVIGGIAPSVIVKEINLTSVSRHPRGWNGELSHQRKLKSYEVESNWYKHFAVKCDHLCRIPKCYGVSQNEGSILIVMEDMDASGFSIRKAEANLVDVKTCISWLANFHALHLEQAPDCLWEVGTYWHLATRPDELDALADSMLKKHASTIDELLNSCSFKTIVHGDSKLANFCFSDDYESVAAVDFQYTGGGCGMKDLAYLIGSCMDEAACEKYESVLLNHYFNTLKLALKNRQNNINFKAVEKEWRTLFPYAWTDFHRFLKGWSPGHWKINEYSEKIARKVIRELEKSHLEPQQLLQLSQLAAKAAKKAGEYIQKESKAAHIIKRKKGGHTISSQIVTKVDIRAEEMILDYLQDSTQEYDFAVLSEEKEDDLSRLEKNYFWCIDPLDGTLPFTEGKDGYAVSIALVNRVGKSLIGVVYDPVKDVLWCASKGNGVTKNNLPYALQQSKPPRFHLHCNQSFTQKAHFDHVKQKVENIAKEQGYTNLVTSYHSGSVMNAIGTLENSPGCYLVLPKKEDGGGSIWDFAATACIFEEAKMPATNYYGAPIKLNSAKTTFMNKEGILFASDQEIHEMLLSKLRT